MVRSGVYNLHMRRMFNDWELEDVGRFQVCISTAYPIMPSEDDEWSWCLENNSIFTIKSAYESLSRGGVRDFPSQLIWILMIPSKASFLLWLVFRERALTMDILIAKGFPMPNRCIMCCADLETGSHLFIHCHAITFIWVFFLCCF